MEFDIAKEYLSIILNKINIEDYKTALINADKLIKFDAGNYMGYYYRGICHFAINEFEKSEQDYQLAIKYKPDFARAYYNLGITQYYLRKFKESVNSIESASNLFSSLNDRDSHNKCIESIDYIKEENGL